MNVLLADDERTIALTLRDDLEADGHDVTVATTGTEAMALLDERRFDCVVTDVNMPGPDGITILREVKRRRPETEVIIITGYGTIESAVEAMKLGALEYVLKPFYNEEIVLLLRHVARVDALREDNLRLREELGRSHRLDNIVGRSEAMTAVFDLVRTVAPTDSNVLVEGESGTGKELVAAALHHNSPRKDRNLVKLSCAAIPDTLLEAELFGHEKGAFTDAKDRKVGRFERADGGTIFLDDIDDMPLTTQVKLLRVLQEREIERLGGEEVIRIDVRVVAATKVDLEDAVREGDFREDLYYRLNVVPIRLPPLRERAGDVPLLVQHFLDRFGKGQEYSVAPEVLVALERYNWPGNVRELENAVERAVALSGESRELRVENLLRKGWEKLTAPTEAPVDLRPLKEYVAEKEKEHIREVLDHTKGHKAQAAQILGISRKNLWEKMSHHDLE
jgi:DNA-binding NtrC family response regulator